MEVAAVCRSLVTIETVPMLRMHFRLLVWSTAYFNQQISIWSSTSPGIPVPPLYVEEAVDLVEGVKIFREWEGRDFKIIKNKSLSGFEKHSWLPIKSVAF